MEKEKNYKRLYNDLLKNSPHGIAIYEPIKDGKNFIFIEFNKAAEKMDKTLKKNLIGKKVTDVFPGVKKMGLFDILKKVYKTGEPEFFPTAFYEDKKLHGWRQNHVHKTFDNNIISIYIDKTKEKKDEQEIKEIEERHSLALQGTSDGLWDWDIINNKTYFSDKWKSMIGYNPDEIKDVFSEWQNRLHPKDKEKCMQYIQKYINSSGNMHFEIEFDMIHKDGNSIPILARAFMIKDKKGKPIRMVGTHIDLTERKKYEEKLKIQSEKLKQNELFLNNIITQSPFSTWISDDKGTTIKINTACKKLFGVKDDYAIIGKYNIFKDDILIEKKLIPLVKTVFEEGKIINFPIDYHFDEVKHVNIPEATATLLDVTIFPIKNKDGEITNAVVQHKDITASKAWEEKDKKHQQIVEQMNTSIQEKESEIMKLRRTIKQLEEKK
ncbi:MAG: PAS domain S-box protein [Candidatus Magasanikbacteria bacterium]|nr:PAS domain S-box protein [Candidatus Magasanikbacteria bacterium]